MRQRLEGLDGLRGIAALAVLFGHLTGVVPLAGWIAQSPLNVFFAGTEAVFVFFILSGFVLALPAASGKAASWLGYYPKRILRLYVPVIAAVAFTLLTILLVPRTMRDAFTYWINMHAAAVDGPGIFRELVLLPGTGAYNSVLWSLRWEVLFSLLLPAYLWAASKARRGWAPGILGMLGLSHLGMLMGEGHLVYLPMFGIGVFLAFALPDLRKAYERWTWLRPVTFLAGMGGLTVIWMAPTVTGRHVLAVASCCLIVLAFTFWQPAGRFATLRPMKWLGSRSFSLYLTHEPIVVSFALIFDEAPWMAVAVAVPVALVVTELFFRIVEKPSTKLAAWAGRLGLARAASSWASSPTDRKMDVT
jgi:peptidoglycan/LPS O-acetylase OafA/YrhL